MDLKNAVVTADAAHAHRETAEYIAGKNEDGDRDSDYFLFVKGNQPSLQRASFDAIQQDGPRDPDHTELDRVPRPHHPPLHLGRRRRRTSTSRTSSGSPGSAATATTATAP